jgi:hypothetical protein
VAQVRVPRWRRVRLRTSERDVLVGGRRQQFARRSNCRALVNLIMRKAKTHKVRGDDGIAKMFEVGFRSTNEIQAKRQCECHCFCP